MSPRKFKKIFFSQLFTPRPKKKKPKKKKGGVHKKKKKKKKNKKVHTLQRHPTTPSI